MPKIRSYALGLVGTCGLPASYGGFETLVSQLVEKLAGPGFEIQVIGQAGYKCFDHEYWSQSILPIRANGISSIPYDIASLVIVSLNCRTVLLLGVSGAISLPLLRIVFPRVKYITHIDGIEWSRPKWSAFAKAFLRLSERFAVHFSDAIIVDNLGIADYVARSYGQRYLKRAFSVAYGAKDFSFQAQYPAGLPGSVVDGVSRETIHLVRNKYFLVLARAEPENNIRMIIEAFIASRLSEEGILLIIVSNAFSTRHGSWLIESFYGAGGVCFAEPIYDTRLVRSIRRGALAYIHGHSAGGTNPSLVEALAAEKPVVAYDVPYNRYTTFDLAKYFSSAKTLCDSMIFVAREGLDVVPELTSLSRENYNWESVSMAYYTLFSNVSKQDAAGISLIVGRFALRLNRKIYSLLIFSLVRFRKILGKFAARYEIDLDADDK